MDHNVYRRRFENEVMETKDLARKAMAEGRLFVVVSNDGRASPIEMACADLVVGNGVIVKDRSGLEGGSWAARLAKDGADAFLIVRSPARTISRRLEAKPGDVLFIRGTSREMGRELADMLREHSKRPDGIPVVSLPAGADFALVGGLVASMVKADS